MENVQGGSLTPIYQRLNDFPTYHPFEAETFADWSMEAGDMVTVSRDGQSYKSPVHTSTLSWKGQPQITVSSGGNEKREPIAKISRNKYNSGGSGVRNTTYFNNSVWSAYNSLHSHIEQTESRIYMHVEDDYNGLRSYIEQTASGITQRVYGLYNGLSSTIEQTESRINLNVSDLYNGLESNIEQTASGIRQTVSNQYAGLSSAIEQTASGIMQTVENNYTGLSSTINQTSSSIRTTVRNNYNNLVSYVDQTSSSWNVNISGVTDANGRVTAASIAAAINSTTGSSLVALDADHIILQGQTVMSDLLTISQGGLQVKGTATFGTDNNNLVQISNGTITAQTYQLAALNSKIQFVEFGGGTYDIDVNVLKNMIKSASVSNNVLTLTPFSGDPITFRKAATPTGEWSNGTLTVTAGDPNNTYVRTLNYGAITWSGNTTTIPITAEWTVGASTYSEPTGKNVYVDASNIRTAGQNDVTLEDNFSWSTAPSTEPGSNSNTASISTTGRSSNVTRSLPLILSPSGWSNNKNTVYLSHTDSTDTNRVAKYTVDASTLVTNATRAGKASVTLTDPYWNSASGTPTSRTVYVKTVGRTNASGQTDEITKSVGLYLVQGSWSSNKIYVYMRVGSTSGTTWAQTQVNASSIYSNGQTAAGLSVNTTNKTVERSLSSSTKSLTISATASISYNSSAHTYTATAQSKAGTTNMGSHSVTSGTQAYNAGIDACYKMTLDDNSNHANNWWNLYIYNSSGTRIKYLQTNQSTTGLYMPYVAPTVTTNGTYYPSDYGARVFTGFTVNVSGGQTVTIDATVVGVQSARAGQTAVNSFTNGAVRIFSAYTLSKDGSYSQYYKFKVTAGGKQKYYYFVV